MLLPPGPLRCHRRPHAGTSSTQPPQPLHRCHRRSTTKEEGAPVRKRPDLTLPCRITASTAIHRCPDISAFSSLAWPAPREAAYHDCGAPPCHACPTPATVASGLHWRPSLQWAPWLVLMFWVAYNLFANWDLRTLIKSLAGLVEMHHLHLCDKQGICNSVSYNKYYMHEENIKVAPARYIVWMSQRLVTFAINLCRYACGRYIPTTIYSIACLNESKYIVWMSCIWLCEIYIQLFTQ
jgi:hypothetical protein